MSHAETVSAALVLSNANVPAPAMASAFAQSSLSGVTGQRYLVQLGSSPGEAGGSGNLVFSSLGYSGAVDDCSDASTLASISGEGIFVFDNSLATAVGPDHAACLFGGQTGMAFDVWYCWTAPCTGTVTVETCGLTDVQTRLNAYDDCGTCPPTDLNLLACQVTSECGFQTRITFPATSGNSYLLRVGSAAGPGASGGVGAFAITCSP